MRWLRSLNPSAPGLWRRTAHPLGSACLLICMAIYAYWGVYLPLGAKGYDFTGPYEAGYALAHHAPLQIYDVPQQRHYNDAFLHLPDGPSDFRWTPQTAALLIPLGLLPYTVAHRVWFLLSQAAVVASLVLLARCLSAAIPPDAATGKRPAMLTRLRSPRIAFAALFCAAALCQPVTDSLRLGQSTPLLLLGFALLIYGEVFERPIVAGCGLGLAILLKLFPAVLLIYYLWRGRYRLCAAAFGFITALTLLTLPLTGLHLYVDFVQAITTYQDQVNAGPVNLSLYHALIVLLSAITQPGQPEPAHGPLTTLALLLCAALFGSLLVMHGWPTILRRYTRGAAATGAMSALPSDNSQKHRDVPVIAHAQMLATACAICAALLVQPIDWIFYYLLLLLPLAALLAHATRIEWERSPSARRWWLLGLLAYLLATLPLPLDSRTAAPMSLAYVVGIALRPVALLALYCVLGWGTWHNQTAKRPETVSPAYAYASALER